MRTLGMAAFVVGVALFVAGAAHAGPCTGQISQLQAAYDAKLGAAAASGPTTQESTAATMHRQPTLNSVAGAEVKLGELSPEKADAFAAAMKRAREADAAGDMAACDQALGDASHALGR